MGKLTRKAAAALILATLAGFYVEAQLPDGRWQRAPLTGAAVIAAVAAITWAENELKGEHDGC